MTKPSLMEQEARESADCVRRQIFQVERVVGEIADEIMAQDLDLIVTCARGSSDHAALFGKYLLEPLLGLPVTSASPSLVSVYDADQRLSRALTVSISQSGKSPDIVAYAEMARAAGSRTLAIVNTPGSPLTESADWTVPLGAGTEKSVAATKSYICTLAALVQLASALAPTRDLDVVLKELPEVLERATSLDADAMVRFLSEEKSCFIVGRGLGFAIAQEAALKLKETCGIHAEAISAAEVQHGPMALLAQGVPVLFLVHGDRTEEEQVALAHRFANEGAKVFLAAPDRFDPDLSIVEGQSHISSAIGMIQTFYLMAAQLAAVRGNNPDQPPLLKKVTETH
ncbi:SIS domain-containing protein [Erythrobacter aureus]|uniref:SIS domain-containing protein n=1 Tax=Erythrobacter aureus TaxID=2182384 RepID=A0A345YH94_9SPHN|nr:SIS domain-containing protein [Erythrobacter aureus]AXK43296.1 SIS domain-containing protein [Erythrobacter aureus]